MMVRTSLTIFVCVTAVMLLCVDLANGVPVNRYQQNKVDLNDLESVLHALLQLDKMNLIRHRSDATNAKRGLDLGLGRGFSGSQAAKHLMGWTAANYAGGPGKRKRNSDIDYSVPDFNTDGDREDSMSS